MFHRTPPAFGYVLDGVFGLPGIAVLALLAGVGMGLTIARIEVPNAPLADAAMPGANLELSDATTLGVADPWGPNPARRSSHAGWQ